MHASRCGETCGDGQLPRVKRNSLTVRLGSLIRKGLSLTGSRIALRA